MTGDDYSWVASAVYFGWLCTWQSLNLSVSDEKLIPTVKAERGRGTYCYNASLLENWSVACYSSGGLSACSKPRFLISAASLLSDSF